MTLRSVRARGSSAALILAGAVTIGACRQTPEQRSAEMARNIATLQNTEQQRLWRAAATSGAAVGIDRLAVVARPVSPRRQITGGAARPAASSPQASVVIPPGVQSQLRVVSAPPLANGYTGAATVAAKTGDRLELEFGAPEPLVVLARAGGAPIPANLNEQVRLVYAPRTAPHAIDETLVIRTSAGKGIGRVIRGATAPVSVTVPLFGVTGTNAIAVVPGAPPRGQTSGVNIVVPGAAPRTIETGETVPFGSVFVMVVASHARSQPTADSGESPPYLVNLLVWSP